jgi:calcium binding protein
VPKQKLNAERERRILQEIVADAHDDQERAMGWFGYLEDRLQFPFTARCIAKRAISPLRAGDEVEVISVAPEEECEREVFVMIRWERDGLGVPLSQLKPVGADEETDRAVADWHYWIARGYRF